MTDANKSTNSENRATAYYSEGTLGSQTYDVIYSPMYPAMLDFYLACAQKYGGPILEIGSGTGLVTWAIARDGHEIVGMDVSKPMLDIARLKSKKNSPSANAHIKFVEADMMNFQLGREFKTAVIPGRSFQHLLTPAEQRAALICIHYHLCQGGMLIMNIYDPKLDYCMPNVDPPVKFSETLDPVSGQKVQRSCLARTTDPLTQTFTEKMLLEVLDSEGVLLHHEETQWSLRWTYQQEMKYLFELTGFKVQEQYSDYHGSAPAYAKEQVWICQKV